MNPKKEEEKRRELENIAMPFFVAAITAIDLSIIAALKIMGVPFVTGDARAEAIENITKARLLGWEFVRDHAINADFGASVYLGNDAEAYARDAVERIEKGSMQIVQQAQRDYTSQEVGIAVAVAAVLLARRAARVLTYSNDAVHSAVEQAKFELIDKMTGGVIGTKKWHAVHDSKTRGSHKKADGQEVPMDSFFHVGGYPMRYPKDKRAPIKETANCRCQTKYSIEWGE